MTDHPSSEIHGISVGGNASGQFVAGRDNTVIHKSGRTPTLTDRVGAVAAALEDYAAQGPDNAEQLRGLAERLRSAGEAPEQNRSILQAVLGAVVGAVAVAVGTEMGGKVTELAVAALQALR